MELSFRPTTFRQRSAHYLVGSLLLGGVFLGAQVVTFGQPLQWGTIPLIPAMGWMAYRWHKTSRQQRTGAYICARLDRLPSDFSVLHDLTIPAPWGHTAVDHVVISRFGIVVAANGPEPKGPLEQVEAVRSSLFANRLITSLIPVRPLILHGPGIGVVDLPFQNYGVPSVRIEHVLLEHLAPTPHPVLNPNQIRNIARHLVRLGNAA